MVASSSNPHFTWQKLPYLFFKAKQCISEPKLRNVIAECPIKRGYFKKSSYICISLSKDIDINKQRKAFFKNLVKLYFLISF